LQNSDVAIPQLKNVRTLATSYAHRDRFAEALVTDDDRLLLVVETSDRQDKYIAHIKTVFVPLSPNP
jgi:hypothetical protein